MIAGSRSTKSSRCQSSTVRLCPVFPKTIHGFIPIDASCQVRDTERVYAAGDATDFPVKFGGVAAQQADTAARAIAALAGAPVEPQPFTPEVHGVLLTGEKPRYLRAHITGGHGASSELTDEPTSSAPAKIDAKYLAPYLAGRQGGAGGRSRRCAAVVCAGRRGGGDAARVHAV